MKKKTKQGKGLFHDIFGIEGDANSPEFLFKDLISDKKAVENFAHRVSATKKRKNEKKKKFQN